MTSFRETLHRLATEQDPAERIRLSDMLASQLEVRENDLSNRTQVAVWDAQESAEKKLDRLHAQVADNNTLISAFLETYGQARAEDTQARTALAATLTEVAARLGKIADQHAIIVGRVDSLEEGMSEANLRLDDHGVLIETLTARVDGIEIRVTALETVKEAGHNEIGGMKATGDQLEQWQENHPPPADLGGGHEP